MCGACFWSRAVIDCVVLSGRSALHRVLDPHEVSLGKRIMVGLDLFAARLRRISITMKSASKVKRKLFYIDDFLY